MKIYKIAVEYKSVNNEEYDDDEDDSEYIDNAINVFQNSGIRYDSSKNISDIALEDGTVIGSTASGWYVDDKDRLVFSFDIVVEEKYRGKKIGTGLVDRAIQKFESERNESEEAYGKKSMMRIEAVNVNFGEYLIRKYGFILEKKFADRIILVKE